MTADWPGRQPSTSRRVDLSTLNLPESAGTLATLFEPERKIGS